MLNTVRADFYRLFRSKSFYITQILLVILITSSILAQQVATIGGSKNDTASGVSASKNIAWTGVHSIQNLSFMSTFIIYFCLSLFVITIGYDLTHGMLKNMLTSGVSRERFFVSKYIVFFVVTAFQFILYYGATFITGSLLNGVGDISIEFCKNFLTGLGLQFLLLQAIFSIAICILYFSFVAVWPVLGVIVIPIIVTAVSASLPKIGWISYFDFSGQITQAMLPHPMSDVLKLISAALGVTLILGSLAFYTFKRKDL